MHGVAKRQVHSHALRHVVAALRRHSASFASAQGKLLRRLLPDTDLPPALADLAWLGEARARLRFSRCFTALLAPAATASEGTSLSNWWKDLAMADGPVFDLLAQGGVFAAISHQTRLPQPTPAMALPLYFALLATLDDQGSESQDLLGMLTDTFWLHRFSQRFPASAVVAQRASIQTLRQRVQRQLQNGLNAAVELREVFHTAEAGADFSLRWRTVQGGIKGPWHQGPRWQGARLKPLKLTAYEEILSGAVDLQNAASGHPI